jgi:cobalt-zinc-cadmium efflux system protein
VADTLSTVAVLAGAVALLIFDVTWIDAVLTLCISVFILAHAARGLRAAASVLIESAPRSFDLRGAVQAVESVHGVEELHHVHVWQIDENRVGLEAHLVMDRSDLDEIERVKREAKAILHDRFGVEHTTLEIEVDACCDEERSVVPMHEAGQGRHGTS